MNLLKQTRHQHRYRWRRYFSHVYKKPGTMQSFFLPFSDAEKRPPVVHVKGVKIHWSLNVTFSPKRLHNGAFFSPGQPQWWRVKGTRKWSWYRDAFLPSATPPVTIWPHWIKTFPMERSEGHTGRNLLWKFTQETWRTNAWACYSPKGLLTNLKFPAPYNRMGHNV